MHEYKGSEINQRSRTCQFGYVYFSFLVFSASDVTDVEENNWIVGVGREDDHAKS